MWFKNWRKLPCIGKRVKWKFRSKTLHCREIKSVFMDVKWCLNASWGLKGLSMANFVIIRIAWDKNWGIVLWFPVVVRWLPLYAYCSCKSNNEPVFRHVRRADIKEVVLQSKNYTLTFSTVPSNRRNQYGLLELEWITFTSDLGLLFNVEKNCLRQRAWSPKA